MVIIGIQIQKSSFQIRNGIARVFNPMIIMWTAATNLAK